MHERQVGDISIARVIESERPELVKNDFPIGDEVRFARYCERDMLVCASHSPSPSFGRVVREGNAFWFQYAKA